MKEFFKEFINKPYAPLIIIGIVIVVVSIIKIAVKRGRKDKHREADDD